MNRFPSVAFWLVVLAANMAFGQSNRSSFQLEDVTKQSGITFRHTTGGSGQGYIVEGVAAGLATFDYDNDGLIDIYFINSRPMRGANPASPLRNALYRNEGGMRFREVTEEAGVPGTGYGLGVVVADYDGDGDQDIYINNYGPNTLYRNNGDKTFTDVTQEAGVDNGDKVGAGAVFFDADGDDDLDLFVGNYIDFTYENHVEILKAGRKFSAGPQYYRPVADTFYRNEGNGKFVDASKESNISSLAGPSMGMIAADLDDDGDIDVFVCNDGDPNFVWLNDGKGHFEESGLLMGLALDFEGHENSNMGVDIGDFNNDGRLDVITTNYQAELPVLRKNLGDGLFEDVTSTSRIPHTLFPHVTWGVSFADFDNDADCDLFVACGHFDEVEYVDDSTAKRVKNVLLENMGGRFRDVSADSGSGLLPVESSRGNCVEDFDNDGDLDLLVLNVENLPTLIRNDAGSAKRWAQVELKQTGRNPNAIGAKVYVSSGKQTQRLDCVAGRGYQSHYGTRLHFGLGSDASEAKAMVHWPDGSKQEFALQLNTLNRIEKK